MKSSLAGVMAGFQSLSHDDSRERPIDRLGALAAMQIVKAKGAEREAVLCALGKDLIALKFANRASAMADASDLLAAILAWQDGKGKSAWRIKLTTKERGTVARQAVHEFAIDLCPMCQGAKEVPNGEARSGAQPMKPCPPVHGCGGSGKRRYSDDERTEAMGRSFARAMAEAHGIIGRAETLAIEGTRKMLERWR